VSAGRALADRDATTHAADAARHVERLPLDAFTVVLSALSPEGAATLLAHVAPSHAAQALARLPADRAAEVAAHIPLDLLAALCRRLDPEARRDLLETLPPNHAEPLRTLLQHEPGTAGGVMDPKVLVVSEASTIADARALIAAQPAHLYYYVYAVDAAHRLVGVFDLAELLQADPSAPVRGILKANVVWLSAEAPLESVFVHAGWREFDALPVVDSDRRFLGVIRHRRMRQLVERSRALTDEGQAVRTVLALGEIYWLGLCGLLQGIATTATGTASGGDRR
jgi:magnesium transporter